MARLRGRQVAVEDHHVRRQRHRAHQDVLQLSLALILVPRYGPLGAAIALLVNTVTQGVVFVWLVQHRFLRIPALTVFAKAGLRPLLAILGLAIYVLLTRDHLQSNPALLAALAGAGLLYVVLTLVTRVWTDGELRLARQMARQVWAARSSLPMRRTARGDRTA